MLTVSDDAVVVELGLHSGRVLCPGCGGRLRPWGWARERVIREGLDTDWAGRTCRPRRARCVACRATHVLLEVWLAARRADSAAVIADALEKNIVLGWGHRRVAVGCGRPASTVRGWLRSFSASAGAIGERFTRLVARDAPDPAVLWPQPASTTVGGAVSALMAYAAGLGRRFGQTGTVTWVDAGISRSNGRLFCSSFWSVGPNTNTPYARIPLSGKVAGAPATPL